jgi:lipid-A-disaccharide synthase-like uncharacterized protein
MTAEEIAIKAVGGLAVACFFSRFLIQWLASERVKRSIVPSLFWHLSLAGSVLGAVYAWLGPHDVVFAAGYVFNLVIYVRNLALARGRAKGLRPAMLALVGLVFAGGAAWAFTHDPAVAKMIARETTFWLAFGIGGQVIWNSRFLLQWVMAERSGRAELPPAFFVISLIGSVLVLSYAIHLADFWLILGNLTGPLVYGRNLVLQRRAAVSGRPPTSAGPPVSGPPASAGI